MMRLIELFFGIFAILILMFNVKLIISGMVGIMIAIYILGSPEFFQLSKRK